MSKLSADEKKLARELYIAMFSNPIYPAHKDEVHLKSVAKQCVRAAQVFIKVIEDR